jgi:hypothetical protein
MSTDNQSPKVASIQWGKVSLEDGTTFKDAKLFPGGSRKWDWNETGTHHSPGIQPADVKELLDHGAKVVILSKGFNERLQVCDETKAFLSEQEVTYHIRQTEKAVQKYNQLRSSKPIGALIHSTC